tara:strand:+ start:99891 stop:102065 length:2175 start_codon:yes stop_codon:yes gene_type:complete
MKRFFSLAVFALLSISTLLAQTKLDSESIWYSPKYYGKTVSGFTSMADGKHYTRQDRSLEGTEINKYDFKSGKKVATLFSTKAHNIKLSGYTLSPSEDFIILGTDVESIYRRSSKGHYYTYQLANKSLKPIANHDDGKISHPTFSPNGKHLAFVRDNNLYIQELSTGKETAVTTDGAYNSIINGMCDWVYEEEFGFTRAFEWSPSGNYLAFIRFDESEVKEWDLTYYGELYPEKYKFKYPKAGEANSKVSVKMYSIADNKLKDCTIPDNNDIYVPRINWKNGSDELVVFQMNRLQNTMKFISYDYKTIGGTIFYTEVSDTYLDLDVTDYVYFLPNNQGFLKTTENDGFAHIYHFSDNGKLLKQITKGDFDVIDVYGFDEKKQEIYFQAAKNSPMDKGVYKSSIKKPLIKALTPEVGTSRANFSSNFSYFINFYSTANTPTTVTLFTGSGKKVRVLEDNKDLSVAISELKLSPKEFITIPTKHGKLNAWMIKPADFEEGKQYPVLMTFYNGPGRNMVENAWGGITGLWHHQLTQMGYIVACVDGRGTMYRGVKFKKSTYLQLGKLETEDQITSAKWLGKLPYVDADRIGVQGWSYGGYMAALCMTKGADVFKAGVSVAPVTNWRYYDNIYTERFMRTPQENASGYDDNSPINHVEKLKGAFLLVHGDADDNVHVQNTMEMVDALVKENKDFELFIYPNKNHGIYGGKTRLHLFNKINKFLENNLK